MRLPPILKQYGFYILWLILGLSQAYYTQLSSDEAYYWVYSQSLAWGYYDHPPMTALMIKLGYAIIHHELGVRFLFVGMSVGTIYFLEKLIRPKNKLYFHLVLLSFAFFQFICFMALPDVPLLFFTTCFFILYRQFLATNNWITAVLLGVVMAAMLLSKYHAFLVLLLVLLSNLSLVRNKFIYLSLAIASLLCMPHLLWQFRHNFPTVYYHFSGRNESYQLFFTIEFLANQLVLLLPLVGALFFVKVIKYKPKGLFETSLFWLFAGFYIFFFFMSFKGRVEPHWTLLTFIPLVYFGYKAWEPRFKGIRMYLLLSIALIFIVRFFIAFDILPENNWTTHFRRHFHAAQHKAAVIDSLAQGRPVVFMNSYQRAALYDFYGSCKPSISLNNIRGRENQYELWQADTSLLGKEILFIPNYESAEFKRLIIGQATLYFQEVDRFVSFSGIEFEVQQIVNNKTKDKLDVFITIKKTPLIYTPYLAESKLALSYQIFDGQECVIDQVTSVDLTYELVNKTGSLHFSIDKQYATKGRKLYVSAQQGGLPPSINSRAWVFK